ncbi:hypothetical protein ACIBL3_45770 [Kribbella sp. NPDC050124]|uniref:hypothetical protein n=1 Tax=Kribbella sp. NPDC050124 TaxID=3364114 RepID=UPI00379CD56A
MSQEFADDNVVDRRMALTREWDELVEEVRKLKGFEDFLRPPKIEDLLPAAQGGPIVVVNVSRWRCDALIVQPEGVTSVALERLTLEGTTQRANEYLTRLRAVEDADREVIAAGAAAVPDAPRSATVRYRRAIEALSLAETAVDDMLVEPQAWMWDSIAEPVLAELGYSDTPAGETESWPRVWWCPTG